MKHKTKYSYPISGLFSLYEVVLNQSWLQHTKYRILLNDVNYDTLNAPTCAQLNLLLACWEMLWNKQVESAWGCIQINGKTVRESIFAAYEDGTSL